MLKFYCGYVNFCYLHFVSLGNITDCAVGGIAPRMSFRK